MSANAPIRNSQGKTVDVLGVDVAADQVLARLRALLQTGLLATGVGVAAALVLAGLIAQLANASLEKIRAGVERIGRGEWGTPVVVQSRDEFGVGATAVNEMAVALRDREMLKGALTRYVSRDVAESVLATRELPVLRGERREITVLIVDNRSAFTPPRRSRAASWAMAPLPRGFTRGVPPANNTPTSQSYEPP